MPWIARGTLLRPWGDAERRGAGDAADRPGCAFGHGERVGAMLSAGGGRWGCRGSPGAHF